MDDFEIEKAFEEFIEERELQSNDMQSNIDMFMSYIHYDFVTYSDTWQEDLEYTRNYLERKYK